MNPRPKMKTEETFGALILTHGRPDNVLTIKSLRRSGYTGPIKLIVDNEDKTAAEYRERYGAENVIEFDKKATSETFDEGDNFEDRRAIIYARNASFEIAKNLGWEYFIMLDDDYTSWRWAFDLAAKPTGKIQFSLDKVFAKIVKFCDSTGAVVALAQGGDLLGGVAGNDRRSINLGRNGKRKAMNTFVCSTSRPIGFVGRINEDVNTYVRKGSTGELFFTLNPVRVDQRQTQSSAGGMSDLYRDSGTYIKSFYTVMYAPSCVKVSPMQSKHSRWHHRISWRNAVPKILHESTRRLAQDSTGSN